MERSKVHLGVLEGWVSSLLNVALFIAKIWAGLAIGSVAMVADAWHTLSDTLTSLVVLFGFWISRIPRDREHPFGHGRAEVIGALVISVLLGIVGVNFIKESVMHFTGNAKAPFFSAAGVAVFAISAVLKEALAQFSFWAGRKISSQALIGDGWHHRSDAVASLLIVVGALLGGKLWWIDGIMGVGVSLLILRAAFEVGKNASLSLMGEEVDRGLEEKIRSVVQEVAPVEVQHIHHLHVHRYGDHREITLHAHMDGEKGLREAHSIASAIERRLRETLRIEATVHMEPSQ